MSSTVVSLALLKAMFDDNQSDLIDAFIPFVSYVVEKGDLSKFSSGDIKGGIEKTFSLKIPIHSIEMILIRMKKRGVLECLSKKDSLYEKKTTLLNILVFEKIKDAFVAEHWTLIGNFKDYLSNNKGQVLNDEEAEESLTKYMDCYAIECIDVYANGHDLKPKKESEEIWRYLVSSYLSYVSKENPVEFEYFVSVLKGRMIMNCVMAKDLSDLDMKFKGTSIYLDSPIVLELLGLFGEKEQEYSLEALMLYKEFEASIKIFQHTIEEVDNILINAEQKVEDHNKRYGSVISYLRERGFTPSDIVLLRSTKEKNLTALGIVIEATPPYVKEYQISEKDLEEEMAKAGLKYWVDAAKRADIQSIRSAYVLRSGRNPRRIEDCKALVLTNNSTLARAAYEYGKKYQEFQHISPIITDFSLTNLLWLKSPIKFGDMPEKILAANCFAALRPSEQVWATFVVEVDKLKTKKDITTEQHAFLRYDSKVKTELVGLTFGNSERVSHEIVMQILNDRENAIVKPYAERCEQLEGKIKEKDSLILQKSNLIERREAKFTKLGILIENGINGIFLLLFFAFFLIVSLNDELKEQGTGVLSLDRNFERAAYILFFLLSFSSFLGFKNFNPVFFLSNKISKFIVNTVRRLLD